MVTSALCLMSGMILSTARHSTCERSSFRALYSGLWCHAINGKMGEGGSGLVLSWGWLEGKTVNKNSSTEVLACLRILFSCKQYPPPGAVF
jgi:hypothetical protein